MATPSGVAIRRPYLRMWAEEQVVFGSRASSQPTALRCRRLSRQETGSQEFGNWWSESAWCFGTKSGSPWPQSDVCSSSQDEGEVTGSSLEVDSGDVSGNKPKGASGALQAATFVVTQRILWRINTLRLSETMAMLWQHSKDRMEQQREGMGNG